jgi:hypothetical protein
MCSKVSKSINRPLFFLYLKYIAVLYTEASRLLDHLNFYINDVHHPSEKKEKKIYHCFYIEGTIKNKNLEPSRHFIIISQYEKLTICITFEYTDIAVISIQQ